MLNPDIFDLVIANHDSKEIHLGSGITGSCNLESMGTASHSIEVAKSKSALEGIVRSKVAKGFSMCGHCVHGHDFDPLLGIARKI